MVKNTRENLGDFGHWTALTFTLAMPFPTTHGLSLAGAPNDRPRPTQQPNDAKLRHAAIEAIATGSLSRHWDQWNSKPHSNWRRSFFLLSFQSQCRHSRAITAAPIMAAVETSLLAPGYNLLGSSR